ncbi:hypothetical protein SAY87_003014 [Trapa incisa]|uniref:GDSL esterase/lipase n=1 Tax=Trapa incisa TaxID=236973 RepID=A0AAN7KNE3_9MYRT|nr:hypothetical protein SAY87_003014 [Trapa incisa]
MSLLLSLQLLLLFLLVISSLIACGLQVQAPAQQSRGRPFHKIYAFGDSFTDTGNTGNANGPSGFGHVSNPPYGMTFFHHPTNRYSDGRLVIDFVAEALSLPYLPPYRNVVVDTSKGGPGSRISGTSSSSGGVNFAVAGSTAINHDFFVKNNLTLDMTPESILTQLVWFNRYLEGNEGCKGAAYSRPCEVAFREALVWVGEIGVNDYAYTIGSSVAWDTVQKLAIDTVVAFLDSLLRMGARYMVVQGLPPTGCLPLAMFLAGEDEKDDIGCVKRANDQTGAHNTVLQLKLNHLRNKYPRALILYADYWNAYRAVMKSPPSRYGFTERFKACCGSSDSPYNFSPFATCGTPSARACQKPSQYINWDGVHLTEAMYGVVSNMFLTGNFSHPPFNSLLASAAIDN